MSKASEFATWFEAQHGKRPSKDSTVDLINNRSYAEIALHNAENVLWRCRVWDARRESALYAWQARADERKRK